MNYFISTDDDLISIGRIDEFGNPVRRTKAEYPYSYDGFVQERVLPNSEANNTVYTDRLLQWDYDKTRRLIAKHWPDAQGDYWSNRSAAEIQEFLREWYDNHKLIVTLVMEYCNVSTGYPLWRIDFRD